MRNRSVFPLQFPTIFYIKIFLRKSHMISNSVFFFF